MVRIPLVYIFLAIALTGLVLSQWPVFVALRNQSRFLVLPISSLVDQSTRRSVAVVELWISITDLDTENRRLGQDNLALKARLDHLQEFERENVELRKQLDVAARVGFGQTVIARVVGLAPAGFFQTATIDRGRKDGIQVGRPVLSSGFLVGTVVFSNPTSATVRLINAHNSVIPVLLETSRTKGLLRGGVRGLVVEDIPVDVSVTIGETVVTAGLREGMPAGISVGEIEAIVSTKGEIFQVARVKSPINFNQLEIVSVIK